MPGASRKKRSRAQREHRVHVTNLAQGGDGVARDEQGRVLFVPGALPGEEVHVVELKGKKSFARTKLLSVLRPSEERVSAPCPHDARCGGCDLLHARFDAQLPLKAQAAWDTLHRLSGGVLLPEEIELLESPSLAGWRTRATLRALRIRGEVRVGFLERGSHRIVPMTRCMMLVEPLQQIMAQLAGWLDPIEGFQSAECFIELATTGGEVVMTLGELQGDVNEQDVIDVLEEVLRASEVLRGVVLERSDEDDIHLGVTTVQAGVVFGRCPEAMREDEFPAGMFRQAHAELSSELVDVVLKQCEAAGGEEVLELFSGCGNFTFALQEHGVTRVLAVEASKQAVACGGELVQRYGLGSTIEFVAMDLHVAGWREALDHEDFELVLLDPPRSGAREVCEGLAGMEQVKAVVYVACDPASLARDLGALVKGGFEVEHVVMCDMFPGTAHVETVVRLRRR